MKVLIISPLTDLPSNGEKFIPLEITNWSNSPIEINSKFSFLAEKDFLESEKHDVKVICLVPTSIRDKLNISFSTYDELINNILSNLKIEDTEINVIPFESTINLGTSLYYIYLSIYKALKQFFPDVILLDVSNSSSLFSSLVLKGLEIAIDDMLLTYAENYIYAIISKRDNGYIQTVLHLYKNRQNVKIAKYLLREMKVLRTEKPVTLPQPLGRAEFRRLAFAIENCLPLVALHILDRIEYEKLMKEEDFIKIIIENIKMDKGNITNDVELLEGAVYYTLARHLVEKYKVNKPFTIDNLRNILNTTSIVCNKAVNRFVDEIMLTINYLLKHNELEGEYRLGAIHNIMKLSLVDFIKNKENIIEMLKNYKRECGDIELTNMGFEPNSTIININKEKIYIYYAEECEDKIMSKVKDMMGE